MVRIIDWIEQSLIFIGRQERAQGDLLDIYEGRAGHLPLARAGVVAQKATERLIMRDDVRPIIMALRDVGQLPIIMFAQRVVTDIS